MYSLSDPLWVHKLSILFQQDRLPEFWPSEGMSEQERINAFTRFVVYLSVILFLVSQKREYLVMGIVVLGLIAIVVRTAPREEMFSDYPSSLEASDKRIPVDSKGCVPPTKQNPFGNALVNEFGTARDASCNYNQNSDLMEKLMRETGSVKDALNQEVAFRQFYQMPSTDGIGDTERFGQFLFGQGPNCKSDHTVCTGFDYTAKSNVPSPM